MLIKKNSTRYKTLLFTLIIAGLLSIAFNDTPGNRYNKILHSTSAILKQVHFSPKKIDDNLSASVFTLFIERIDPDKEIFTQADVDKLSKYKTKIDDEINGDSIQFFTAAITLLNKRIIEMGAAYKTITQEPFHFSEEELLIVNDSDQAFARNTHEQNEKWRKRIKYIALQKYTELVERNENIPADSSGKKTETQLEKEARDYASVVTAKYFNRIMGPNAKDNFFSIFMNTITNYMDPHTDFFMPVEKRAWDEDITGKFYGIGAIIGEEKGQLLISSVSPGGAAWKTGEVNNGDIILKIAEGENEAVDVAGYEIPDAVKLIRGKKGTTVKLTLKKTDGSVKTVAIARQELKLEETFAKSSILVKDLVIFLYLNSIQILMEKMVPVAQKMLQRKLSN
jgi:carboxyl-terminal processing protease